MTDKKKVHFDGINIFRKGDPISYGVGMLPGNIRPSLFKKNGNKITPIASFPKTDNAIEFTNFLERLANDVNRGRTGNNESESNLQVDDN